jgi:hypothetical protein
MWKKRFLGNLPNSQASEEEVKADAEDLVEQLLKGDEEYADNGAADGDDGDDAEPPQEDWDEETLDNFFPTDGDCIDGDGGCDAEQQGKWARCGS